MNGKLIESLSEEQSRLCPVCPGCGDPKSERLMVCWRCWSETNWRGVPGFKFFDGTFADWLELKGWIATGSGKALLTALTMEAA